jgi:hydrogenase maturation factor
MTRDTADAPPPIAAAAPACDPAAPGGCAICADEALRARVVTVDGGTDTADVFVLDGGAGAGYAAAGARLTVALDLVDDVAPGDLVLVHQGFVISRVEAP